jgi:hypothetical protein
VIVTVGTRKAKPASNAPRPSTAWKNCVSAYGITFKVIPNTRITPSAALRLAFRSRRRGRSGRAVDASMTTKPPIRATAATATMTTAGEVQPSSYP